MSELIHLMFAFETGKFGNVNKFVTLRNAPERRPGRSRCSAFPGAPLLKVLRAQAGFEGKALNNHNPDTYSPSASSYSTSSSAPQMPNGQLICACRNLKPYKQQSNFVPHSVTHVPMFIIETFEQFFRTPAFIIPTF